MSMRRFLFITPLLLVTALLASASGQAQQQAGAQPRQAGAAPARDDVVSWITIGGSSRDQARRQVGWRIDQFGWRGFIERVVDPAVRAMRAQGVRPRIVLHNPFGTLANESMQFDQALHAEQGVVGVHPPLPWLRRGFEQAWRAWMRDNPDVQVICYFGSIRGDADFSSLEAPGRTGQWLARFWASCRPALDVGMDIGFDASGPAEADSPTAAAMRLVKSLGHEVYVEARPGQAHWAGWPVISEARYFRRSDPERHPDAKALGNLPNDQLGRTMIIIGWHTPAERKQLALEHVAEGRDVALAVPLEEFNEIMRALNAQSAATRPAR